jgi:hypothetical protein
MPAFRLRRRTLLAVACGFIGSVSGLYFSHFL